MWGDEFESYEDLEEIIEMFMNDINSEVSQGTNEIPFERHKKETKYLLPLTNIDILKSYVTSPKEYKVSKESMIKYKGKNSAIFIGNMPSRSIVHPRCEIILLNNTVLSINTKIFTKRKKVFLYCFRVR